MIEATFRPARKSDCPFIARLYSIASDGIADCIWSKYAEPGEDLLEVGCRRYEREDTAEGDARKRKLSKTSLLVFEKNAGARRLYDRLGYREVARKVVPHPLVKLVGNVKILT